MSEILTLDEYKASQGIGSADGTYDLQLEALIPTVNDFIENYCERQFGSGIQAEEQREGIIDHKGRYFFTCQNRPVDSVESVSVKYVGFTDPVDIDVTKLDLFKKQGYAYYNWILFPAQFVMRPEYLAQDFYYTINYTFTFPVPPQVKLAAVHMVHDNFEYLNRTASATVTGKTSPGDLKRVTIGDYTEEYNTSETLISKFHDMDSGLLLTPTVKALLDPFVIGGQSW